MRLGINCGGSEVVDRLTSVQEALFRSPSAHKLDMVENACHPNTEQPQVEGLDI